MEKGTRIGQEERGKYKLEQENGQLKQTEIRRMKQTKHKRWKKIENQNKGK